MVNSSNTNYSQYAVNRIVKEFGDLHTAKQNGVSPVKTGIKFVYRDLQGYPVKFIPSVKRSTKYATKKAKSRDAQNPYSDESKHLAKTYARYRYAPEYIPENAGKYKGPSRFDAYFQPLFLTNSIINAYREGDKIDTLYLTEGEAKAAILDTKGNVCAGGFGGVSVYWLTDELKKFIKVCRPEQIVILYDSDALNISKNWTSSAPEPVNQRPLNFLNSALKFAGQFFTHIKETYGKTDYKPNLFFTRNIETENQKAVDDMLINLTDQNGIIDALEAKENTKYFDYIQLSQTNYTNQLQQYFHLQDVRSFYNLHKERINDCTFKFNHCGYDIKWRFDGKELIQEGLKKDINIEIPQGQKLSSIAPELLEIIKDQEHKNGAANIQINAPMGIGKNHTTVNLLAPALEKTTRYKSAIICPLNALVQQTAATYNIEGLTGTPKAEQVQKAKEKSIFAINHNALPKVESSFEKLNLFIDESHTIPSGAGYKSRDISKLVQSIDRVGHNKIMLSATPSIYPKLNGYQQINIIQESINTTSIYYQKCEKTKVKVLKKLIDNRATDQITVVKIQSKSQLRKIKKVLTSKYGYNENEIILLYSEKHIKQLQHYKQLIISGSNTNSFAPSVKVVLCTSFINEGINIYESDKEIQFINVESQSTFFYDDLVQLVGRWRTTKDKTVFSFHPIGEPKHILVDAHTHIAEYLDKTDSYTGICNFLNQSTELTVLNAAIQNLETGLIEHKKYLIKDENGHYTVNDTAITADCEITRKRYLRTDVSFEQLQKKHNGFEVLEITEDTELETKEETRIDDNLQEQHLIDKEDKREAEKQIIDLLKNNTLNFVGAVQQETEKLDLMYLVCDIFPELSFESELKLQAQKTVVDNKKVFTEYIGLCETVVKNLCKGLNTGFDKENILQALIEQKTEIKDSKPIVSEHLRSSLKLKYLFETINIQLLLELKKVEGIEGIDILDKVQKLEVSIISIIQTKLLNAFNGGGGKLSNKRLKYIINTEYQKYVKSLNEGITDDTVKLKLSTNKTHPTILKRLLNSLFVCSRVGRSKDWEINKDVNMLDHIKSEFGLSSFDPSPLLKSALEIAENNRSKQPEMVKGQKQGAKPCIQGVLW